MPNKYILVYFYLTRGGILQKSKEGSSIAQG
jgi:hypothetical protein